MRWMIIGVAVGAALYLLAPSAGDQASANHPWGWPNTNYDTLASNLWYNYFNGSDRTHNVTFRVCNNLGDPFTSVWALWQGYTLNSNYRYNVQWITNCGQGTNLLIWGRTAQEMSNVGCGGAWACIDSWCNSAGPVGGVCKWDGAHYGGKWVNDVAIMYVNSSTFNGHSSDYFRFYTVNHEHGHVNGLDDHTLYVCDTSTVMSRGVQSTSCVPQYPTTNDFNSINCNYYYQC